MYSCAGFGSYTCKFLAPTVNRIGSLGYTSYVNTIQKDTEIAGFADASY